MKNKTNTGLKIICFNRKARFNYFLNDLLEAGIVLKGSEIKSIREGKVNIADSYAIEKNGEIFLINSHIPIYKEAERIDKILQPVHKSMFIESNPSPVKYAAKLLGLCDDEVRLPLVRVTKNTEDEVKKTLSSAKLI